MTLRLTIDERAFRTHIDTVRSAVPGLVPVVKGNGYGFGRGTLARLVAEHAAEHGAESRGEVADEVADEIAVGTVHELADVVEVVAAHPHIAVVALTPGLHLPDELPHQAVPTVGSPAHVDALRRHGWHGRVAVKLESSMHRHGAAPAELDELLAAVRAAGMQVHQFVLHLPLPSASFTPDAAVAQIDVWLPRLEPAVPVSLSHLSPDVFQRVRADHADRTFRLRSGTALWHGDKSFLHLSADVLAVRSIVAGEPCGYRQHPATASGHLVMVGAGSAHGVVLLDGGLSPFHHQRRRMELVEASHMHTSIALLPNGVPVPTVGDWVDVQRPLTSVAADVLAWT